MTSNPFSVPFTYIPFKHCTRWENMLFKIQIKKFQHKIFYGIIFQSFQRNFYHFLMLYQLSDDLILCLSPIMIYYFPNLCQLTLIAHLNADTFYISVGVGFNRSLKLQHHVLSTTLGSIDTIPSFTTYFPWYLISLLCINNFSVFNLLSCARPILHIFFQN